MAASDQDASAATSRDSHDLSLSPRNVTRDSLVNNMLLSLDQFSLGQKAAASGTGTSSGFYGGGGGGGAGPPLSYQYHSHPSYHHHHSHQHGQHQQHHHHHHYDNSRSAAATSANFDASSAKSIATRTTQFPFLYNRRLDAASSSASASPSASASTSAADAGAGAAPPTADDSSPSSFYTPPPVPPRVRRSGSSSKPRFSRIDYSASATAVNALPLRERSDRKKSLDGTYLDPGGPASPGFEHWNGGQPFRRSLSFDQVTRQGLRQHFHDSLLSPIRFNFPAIDRAVDDDDGDDGDGENEDRENDCPSASATAQSRSRLQRIQSAFQIYPPLPPPPPEPFDPHNSRRERERSTSRSLKSSSGRSTRGGQRLRSTASAMPLSDYDVAPSPNVSYGKSKAEQAAIGPPPTTPPQPKEKQGFFRRVFGSRASSFAVPEPQSQPQPLGRQVSASLQQVGSISKSMTNTASKEVSSSQQPSQPPLQKKSSSFFKRYLKSATDEPPPLPADAPPSSPPPPEGDLDLDQAFAKSPTSSLSKIMTPYLGAGSEEVAAAAAGHGAGNLANVTNTPPDCQEFKREFSPDYEPGSNARIRAVTSDSDQDQYHDFTSGGESPTLRRTLRSTRNLEKRSDSFLDLGSGSDYDNDSPRTSRKGLMESVKENHNDDGKENSNDSIHRGNNITDSDPLAGTRNGRDKNPTLHSSKRHTYKMGQGDPDNELTRLKIVIPENRSTSLASSSTEADYKTAPSAPPSLRIEVTGNHSPLMEDFSDSTKTSVLDEHELSVGEPTEDERSKAQQIFDGVEEFIPKDKAAAWMGEEGCVRQRTLQAYMELFDFTDLSVVNSLRKVCGRLVLRAETQQVDRIFVAFSKRWCDCNPLHGFKSKDIIHTICYSIMLLNTDLHIADIEQKMTRSQFVKNTIATITQAIGESIPDALERPSILPEKNALLNGEPLRPSTEHDRRTFRNSFRPSPRVDTFTVDPSDEAGPLVKAPFYGTIKGWEEQVENVLKMSYVSIRDEALPLFGSEPEKPSNNLSLQGNLSVMGMLKRSPSVLSKAPSEGFMSTRGRAPEGGRNSSARWTSKNRSRPGLGRNGFSSSRTSFDDASSVWSPALSSATWSRYSLGRTHTSVSQDSLGSAMPRGDYQQSIGFANALSQAIIRDDDASAHDTLSIMSADVVPATPMLDDESLELSGPPWVKEGRLMHKHHLDGTGKRAKDRNWSEVFAVVQKGHMSLFSFNASKSLRQKNRGRNAAKLNGPVGGGNWQDNAIQLCTFNLRLTLASALPPPGYSRTRPFVWALSLPTGAVHLFQVGTPEIIKEFVDTANYWAARLSSHPLIGGISNMEYGWSDGVVDTSSITAVDESSAASVKSGRTSRRGSNATHSRKLSTQSAILHPTITDAGSVISTSGGEKFPGDRVTIATWTPPTQSMRPSNLPEGDQLGTLSTYVKSLEQELQVHNRLREPMLLAYTPKSQNAGKAMANWERKSSYLLRETVKFRTYVETLQQAGNRKREIYKERDLARRAALGELTDAELELSGGEEDGDETLRP